ncbi:hypothetical protein PG988_006523 [Apiospora saccharicola]
MKFLVIAAAFTFSVRAVIGNPCSDGRALTAAMNNWILDLIQVNDAIDNQLPTTAASNSIFFMLDEGKQQDLFISPCHPFAFPDQATEDRFTVDRYRISEAREQLLGVFSNIQQGVGPMQNNLDDINRLRCCDTLPRVERIIAEVAKQQGHQDELISLTAPRPKSCNTVASPMCSFSGKSREVVVVVLLAFYGSLGGKGGIAGS